MKKILNNNILILPEKEDAVKGGIIIPDHLVEIKLVAEVVGVGHKVSGVKVGDKVLFRKNSGLAVEEDNKKLLFIREGDVMGII